jgi:Pyruvate/2-oxoacid:ferredoxin oxidoreductase delta subunit
MKKVPDADMLKCKKCSICFNTCSRKAVSVISNSCCAKCIKYCISFIVPCHPEYISIDYNLCDSCGECVEKCPNGAIYWSDMGTAILRRIEHQ